MPCLCLIINYKKKFYFKLLKKTDIPNAPSGLKIASQGPDHLTIEWNPPASDGGAKISGYNVEIRDDDTDEWYAINDSLIKGNSFTGIHLYANK